MYSILKYPVFGITALLLMVNGFGTVMAHEDSSLIALLNETAYTNHHQFGSFMEQLTLKSVVMIKPFEKLITKLNKLDKNACEMESEELFAITFRSIEGSMIDCNDNAKAFEGIRALYSIRKAICETRTTIVEIPPPCVKLVPNFESIASRQSVVEAELGLAGSNLISACLRRFKEHHYFWTSYSNNLQESNTIVHLLRSDIELRSMAMTYRDFEASINDLQDELTKLRALYNVWVREAEHNFKAFLNGQKHTFAKFEQHLRNVSQLTSSELDHITSRLADHHVKLQESSSAASEQLDRVIKNLSSVNSGIVGMQRDASQLYTGVATELANIVRSQKVGLEDLLASITDKVSPIAQNLGDLDFLSSNLSTRLQHSSDLQALNVEQIQTQSILGAALFTKLIESFEVINSTHEILEQVSIQAKDFNTVVNNVTYLLTLAEQFKQVLILVAVYMLLSLLLVPLEWAALPHHMSVKIKVFCCALYSTSLMLEWLHLDEARKTFEQFMTTVGMIAVWCMPVLSVALVVLIIEYHRQQIWMNSYVHEIELAHDIELAHTPQLIHIDAARWYYDNGESYTRTARYGSTPPGL